MEKNNLPAAARGPAPCENLYSVAGQTIFQIYSASGAPMDLFESYHEDKMNDPWITFRPYAIRRTKQEYEAEQYAIRGVAIAIREECAKVAESVVSDMDHVSDQDAEYEIGIRNETARGIADSIRKG